MWYNGFMMKCGVYKIVNKVNGKMYIGQSVDIERRWREHIYNVGYDYRKNHLYSAMRKDGLDNFVFSVIVECDEYMLDEFEIGIIKLYETTNPEKGYNLMSGGANGRPTEETKQKLSESMKGRKRQPFSDEHKKKMSESKIKQYLYQGTIYNGIQELSDFLGMIYSTLAYKISRKQIDVTIIKKDESDEKE